MSCDKVVKKFLNLTRDGKRKTGVLNRLTERKISQLGKQQEKTTEGKDRQQQWARKDKSEAIIRWVLGIFLLDGVEKTQFGKSKKKKSLEFYG